MLMALKAPFHEQRVFPPRHRHLVDGSVARRALNTSMHVDAVIEINEIRETVHAGPLERAILTIACAHRFQRRAVRPHLRVAVHAGLRRWNPCKGTVFDGSVAVATVDADARHVMLVAEWHGLLPHHARFSKVWRTNDDAGHGHQRRNYEKSAE